MRSQCRLDCVEPQDGDVRCVEWWEARLRKRLVELGAGLPTVPAKDSLDPTARYAPLQSA